MMRFLVMSRALRSLLAGPLDILSPLSRSLNCNPAGEIAQGWFWEPASEETLKHVKKKRFTGSKQPSSAILVREGEVDPADSLSEVRPMINTLASTCKRNYHPGENLAFDLSTRNQQAAGQNQARQRVVGCASVGLGRQLDGLRLLLRAL